MVVSCVAIDRFRFKLHHYQRIMSTIYAVTTMIGAILWMLLPLKETLSAADQSNQAKPSHRGF